MSIRTLILGITLAAGAAPGGAPPDLHVYTVEPGASRVYVVTHRSGVLSFLGHEHGIIPLGWQADLCLAEPVPAGAHGEVVVRTASLVVDSDSARAVAGLGAGPGPDDRATIQQKMLDVNHLDAAGFPEIRLALRATAAESAGRVRARATVTLHGHTRTYDLPVTIEHAAGPSLVLSGDLRLRQRDFGIEPESVAGVVRVANDVDLHFLLASRPTADACE